MGEQQALFRRRRGSEIQDDAKILLVGYFKSYNGKTVNGIVRLDQDGAIDTVFHSGLGFGLIDPGPFPLPVGTGELWPLSGRRFLVGGGGNFDSFDGQRVTPPFVLNADGTRDRGFVVSTLEFPWGAWPPSVANVVDGRAIVWTPTGLGRLVMGQPSAPETPLRILDVTRTTNGAVEVTIMAQPGVRYTLEVTDDLHQWTELKSQVATGNQLVFLDPSLPSSQRFYRVRRE